VGSAIVQPELRFGQSQVALQDVPHWLWQVVARTQVQVSSQSSR
jgi:hypothetical protein